MSVIQKYRMIWVESSRPEGGGEHAWMCRYCGLVGLHEPDWPTAEQTAVRHYLEMHRIAPE